MAIRPFPIGIDAPPLPGTDRSKIGLLWASVEKCAQVIRALVGGKLLEYHEDELIDSTGQSITHNLGRLPRGWIITYRDGNRVIYGDKERNTTTTVFIQTGAGAIRANFLLFVLLLALVAPMAQAAECAAYGYAQAQPVRFWLCNLTADTTTGAAEGDYRFNKDTNALLMYDGAAWNAVGGGSGAPTNAQYWVGAADATLSAEHNLGALATGLVINTTGTPSAYTGTSCTNQFPRSLSASGAATCASVASADLSITGTTCTNQFLSALSSSAAGTCTTATLAGTQFANQGTTTTLLHGNAAGNPSWGAVALASDVSGVLGDANGGTGSDTTVLAANRMFVTTGTAYSPFAIPDCDDSGGQHLNYNDAAGGGPAFSCGTSSSGGTTPTGTGYRHVTGGVEDAAADLVTLTSATEVAPNQGTTTTVLHGNAAGQASFASVDLTNDTSSVLPLAKLTDDGVSGLCLISGGAGDPIWDTCPGGGGGLSYAQVAAAVLAGF